MLMPEPVSVDGKFFRAGGKKYFPCGLAYGPLRPNAAGEPFAAPAATLEDFGRIRDLGANLLRIYHVPPRWFLDMAADHGVRLLVDIPWNKEVCFLETAESRAEVRRSVRSTAKACAQHPAVFAISVVNEIRPDLVRWSGVWRVAQFIDALVAEVKTVAPQCLCTFGNYPPTEFLRSREIDFHCFNVYLHQQQPFENYLSRLQMIADGKPLLLGEIGIDSVREGQERQASILSWQIESAFRYGAAGVVVYSYTDEWFKDCREVSEWRFGVTTQERQPKPAYQAVQSKFRQTPDFPADWFPRVSVVVASYNGAKTLKACLDSLQSLRYPDYEVILVDDGSMDNTPELARHYPKLRWLRHRQNLGLSEARNTGIAAATGEIVAFTDADCRADVDWLYHLVSAMRREQVIGIGGPNLLPPDDSCVASAVMLSPGGPAHVMLTDRRAEHIPGCNMAFYRWALLEIGGFDPQFRQAGDDVDICWRLQQAGFEIGFSPAGFVWHYRRSRVKDYLRQQYGYGEAEAMLVRKHPEFFNGIGGGLWRGRIYSPARVGVVFRPPRIYYGPFASGYFQSLYAIPPVSGLMLLTTLEYHVLVTLVLWMASTAFRALMPLAIISLGSSVAVCVMAAIQAEIPTKKRRFWSRPLVGLLFFLQPIVRGWARYHGRLVQGPLPLKNRENLETLGSWDTSAAQATPAFWGNARLSRVQFLNAVVGGLRQEGWTIKTDTGWGEYDLEVVGDRWSRLQLASASEFHPGDKQLFRCRLRPRWSLLARAILAAAIGIEFALSGLLGGWEKLSGQIVWSCLILGTTFGLGWLFHRRTASLRRILGVFLDKTAESMGLVKVEKLKSL
ncbi:MAG TPA: glycosyltransferase [Candidatus Paceibacterota bacterium]|nr:glycosyltransferase [Verrucomicrobiota bacterium]HSA00029.1 glycosyltransferase [Candidatus Paceibacterota bacterium]